MGLGFAAQLAREQRVDGLVAADHAVLVGAHLAAPQPRGAREHDGERRLDLARVKRADIIALARSVAKRGALPWGQETGRDRASARSAAKRGALPLGLGQEAGRRLDLRDLDVRALHLAARRVRLSEREGGRDQPDQRDG